MKLKNCLLQIVIIVFLFGALNPLGAQTVDLICVDKKDNFTIPVSFNETTKLVTVYGNPVEFSEITNIGIRFTLILKGKNYLHFISRQNGAMTVWDTTAADNIVGAFQCSSGRRKF
jgi:hypothetical protein